MMLLRRAILSCQALFSFLVPDYYIRLERNAAFVIALIYAGIFEDLTLISILLHDRTE